MTLLRRPCTSFGHPRALLARMGVAQFESPVNVVRERRLPGISGRVDSEATDCQGRVVVIETKGHASPDPAQRQRYEHSYRTEGHSLAAVAIVSTAFDAPWDDLGSQYIRAETLLDILRVGHYEGDLLRQYVLWLDHLLSERRAAVERALGNDPDVCSQALQSAAAQWVVMRRLGDKLGGPAVARLYSGQNKDGSPWTQLAISPGGPPAFDALFYRLDSWVGTAAQFTLRQYQKPADSGKLARLLQLRTLFRSAAERSPISFDTAPRRSRKHAQEAKIAQVTIQESTMDDVLGCLPDVHRRFVESLCDLGWPIGPGSLYGVPRVIAAKFAASR